MKRISTTLLTLLLLLQLAMPARAAGLFDWLTGKDDPTPAPAMAEATPTTVTLPPADALADDSFFAAPSDEADPEPTAGPTPSPEPAPIPEAALEDDGLLRVDLRSLDNPTQLHLTLAGVYAVGDCNGKSMMAHTAYREAEVAVRHMLGIRMKCAMRLFRPLFIRTPKSPTWAIRRRRPKRRG